MSPRRAIVLGGGGVLGGTWAVGALVALERSFGFDARTADILVGTSAGALIASMLGAGVTPEQLRQRYGDEPVEAGPLAGLAWDSDAAVGGRRPGTPRDLLPGSLGLLGHGLRRDTRLPATALVAGLMPRGGRTMAGIGRLVDAVSPIGEWSAHPACWIVAMDYRTGHREVFGRPGAPTAPLSSAVMASCSIPGWFAPVEINDRPYVDGGAVSSTNIDVLEHEGLDEVYVIAPMVSFSTDRPSALSARLERRWREEVTRACLAEADLVERAGAIVHVIGPGADDLAAMGANLMDATRRRHVLDTSMRTSATAWNQQCTSQH